MAWQYLAQAGSNLLSAGASYLVNGALGREARYENYLYNERAADHADERTRKLWQDQYSIQAQMKDAKEAGLNPSMFYQGQGTVGQSGAMGAGAGGVGAPYMSISPIDVAGIELAKAQAEKTRAEKDNIEEDTISKELANYITSNTTTETIEQKKLTTQQMAAELQNTITQTASIQWTLDFNKLTQDEQYKQLLNKNAVLLSEVVLNQSSAKLNDREREHFDTILDKWQMDVYQKFVEMDIYQQSVDDQNEWFDEQALNLKAVLENQKDQFGQQIKLNRTSMWLDFGSDILKTAIYGGTLYATGGLSGLKKMPTIGFK